MYVLLVTAGGRSGRDAETCLYGYRYEVVFGACWRETRLSSGRVGVRRWGLCCCGWAVRRSWLWQSEVKTGKKRRRTIYSRKVLVISGRRSFRFAFVVRYLDRDVKFSAVRAIERQN